MNTIQTTPTKTFKRNTYIGLVLFFCVNLFLAQNRIIKHKEEFSLAQIPLLKLNTSHTQIKFTSWDKKYISIHAYVEGDADEEYLGNIKGLWDFQIQSSDSILIVTSDASKQLPRKVISQYSSSVSSDNGDINSRLKSTLEPMLIQLESTQIPVALKGKLNNVKFNYNAYNRLGETYLRIWENNLIKGLDENATSEVRNWSKNVTNQLVKVSTNSQDRKIEKKNITYSFIETHTIEPTIPVSKILEIKVPNRALTYFNTRYGSLNISNTIKDIQGKLKYTPFVANEIDGENTDLSISFAPFQINNWKKGDLHTQYVKSGELGEVNSIELTSNSSKILIHSLKGSGDFKITFSQLGIDNTLSDFRQLSFLTNNSDLVLRLPNNPFNFVYSGEMSNLKIPEEKLTLKSLGDYRNLMLHGYSISRNTDKAIQMNVVNSRIVLK